MVEFWYNTQVEAPAIMSIEDLQEGFEKAGYILQKKY